MAVVPLMRTAMLVRKIWSRMVVDFHAHILPGVDHGCRDLEEAISQCSLANKAGVDTIVSTPHFYPHKETLAHFLPRREAGYRQLCSALGIQKPEILLGAEVMVCEGLERMEKLKTLCIPGTKCILLEMPRRAWNDSLFRTVVAIRDQCGLTPVMAHVDRYEEADVERLFYNGIKAQLNAEGVCRLFKRNHLLRWVAEEKIVALGSDIHGVETGYKYFLRAKKILGHGFAEIMDQTAVLLRK